MNTVLSAAPKRIEELRYQGLVRFAELLESQTRTRLSSENVNSLVCAVNAEIQATLQDCVHQLQDRSDHEQVILRLQSSNARSIRLNSTLALLFSEHERQWNKNEGHLKHLMLDFGSTVESLAGTLIEKELLERQSNVLQNIIISHEKVSQWKLFVQEILAGFHTVFPFNFFFIAFAEEHGLSLYLYFLGDYADEIKSLVRKKLAHDMLSQLGLPDDALLDIEEFHIPTPNTSGAIDEIKLITVSVPDLDKLNLAGLLGVAYGSVQKLSAQEASVIRSILAVMVMVVGSSKALSRTMAELEYYSSHDPLTGLHNRRYFNDMLEYEIGRSERHKHEFSILMLDLDDFKDINDTYGHPCGDAVLVGVADAMRAAMRKGDLATRIGGDEFAIILTETGKDGGMNVANKLRSELRDFVFNAPDGKAFHITTSIGLVAYPGDAQSQSDLMSIVDLGLYRAKQLGKDTVCSVETAVEKIQESRTIRDQAETLRSALHEGRIVPFYQPIIDCRTGEIFAYETLARLCQPNGETVSAGMFIETLEKYGLGRELDRVIINTSLLALKERIDRGVHTAKLFINLSAQEIQGRGVLGFAEKLCQEIGIPPSHLVFEILERDAIGDMTHMRKFLTELRKKGFSFALDDFGSGYNSFHYLRELQFDFVKLDGAFVRNILNSKIDYALVKNLSHLCQDLGILMVAEFIESREIMEAIQSMGIEYAQGFHLGMPKPRME